MDLFLAIDEVDEGSSTKFSRGRFDILSTSLVLAEAVQAPLFSQISRQDKRKFFENASETMQFFVHTLHHSVSETC